VRVPHRTPLTDRARPPAPASIAALRSPSPPPPHHDLPGDAFIGGSNAGHVLPDGASNSTSPSSTSCITTVTVQTLVIDWIMNNASEVTQDPCPQIRHPGRGVEHMPINH